MIPFPIIIAIIVVLYILSSVKILREYERGVIFRLGRSLPQAKGPGIILVFARWSRSLITFTRLRNLLKACCAQSWTRWSWTNCWLGGKRSICACRALSIAHRLVTCESGEYGA